MGQRGHQNRARRILAPLLVALAVMLAAAPSAAPQSPPSPPPPVPAPPPPPPSPPQISYACSPAPADCSGWFRSDVTLTWTITPASAPSQGCGARQFSADTPGIEVTCSAGSTGAMAVGRAVVRLDRTPPVVTAAVPARQPNRTGWFTKAVRVDFFGDDATSGIASCRSATYAGPDDAAASILGRCRDQAGNVSSRAFSLPFDATPPLLAGLSATPGDGRVLLQWQSTPDVRWVEVTRSPGFDSDHVPDARAAKHPKLPKHSKPPKQQKPPKHSEPPTHSGDHSDHNHGASVVFPGPASSFLDDRVHNGIRYDYRVRVADEAGNHAEEVVAAVPVAVPPPPAPAPPPVPASSPRRTRLLSPGPHARISWRHPPLLRWVAVRRARYYNVQVFRGHRKVLSVWPRRPHYQLKRRWSYHGTTQRLRPGRYRWFVWPGFGSRHRARYGHLLGRRSFTVVR
jgi:hypothetical protein